MKPFQYCLHCDDNANNRQSEVRPSVAAGTSGGTPDQLLSSISDPEQAPAPLMHSPGTSLPSCVTAPSAFPYLESHPGTTKSKRPADPEPDGSSKRRRGYIEVDNDPPCPSPIKYSSANGALDVDWPARPHPGAPVHCPVFGCNFVPQPIAGVALTRSVLYHVNAYHPKHTLIPTPAGWQRCGCGSYVLLDERCPICGASSLSSTSAKASLAPHPSGIVPTKRALDTGDDAVNKCHRCDDRMDEDNPGPSLAMSCPVDGCTFVPVPVAGVYLSRILLNHVNAQHSNHSLSAMPAGWRRCSCGSYVLLDERCLICGAVPSNQLCALLHNSGVEAAVDAESDRKRTQREVSGDGDTRCLTHEASASIVTKHIPSTSDASGCRCIPGRQDSAGGDAPPPVDLMKAALSHLSLAGVMVASTNHITPF